MRPIAVPTPTDCNEVMPSADFSDAFAIDGKRCPVPTFRAASGAGMMPAWANISHISGAA